MTPAWVSHAIWWQVYPLGFVGAFPAARPPDPGEHRLRRLVDWFDHAIALGASGVALGPVFASRTHGYDTTDHYRIDPRLGDDADFDHVVAEAHRRGLRVLLDGVFNHVGVDFPRYRDAPHDEASARWFRGRPGSFDTFEGHPELITLNHDNPEVADYTVDVMTHWLGRGADGWRLDAAYAVPQRFWASTLPRVRERFPDAWFVGELIHGDYAAVVEAATFDSATQYELWKAIWSGLNDRNFFELDWALRRHNGFLASFAPLTFIGNHDVTRVASRLERPEHLPHALVILLTVGGVPSVYAGDELGFRGVKEERRGGDGAVRPEFGPPQHHWTTSAPRCGGCTSTSSGSAAVTPGCTRRRPPRCGWKTGTMSTRPAPATMRCWSRSTSTTSRCAWCCRSWAPRGHGGSPGRRPRRRTSWTRRSSSRTAG